ncbi:MAG: Uncharacterised protein [Halieaceae bacterium]|nr:MAG: Uncharacterised protein [Halieaceae bacterium]
MREVLVHDVIDIDHDDAHQIPQALAAQQLQAQAQFHESEAVRPVLLHQLGRTAAIERRHQLGEATHHLFEVAVGGLIRRIDAGAADGVAVDNKMVAIGLQ